MPDRTQRDDTAQRRFGTFGGVFTPCVLTILGVIMFLRFGQVVGNSGIVHAILIVLIAKAITLLTGLSLSAIATNTRTEGGGAYFLISRSLGVEYGGAIGLVFFIAQAISVAMYVIGFSEAFITVFPGLNLVAVASAVNILVFICVYIGAGWTIKVQYVILGILALSLVSFGAGAVGDISTSTLRANLDAGYSSGTSMVTMFALFFPAVTGIMAGANMSGDLKDPARAIPAGTLAAILVTGVIYLGLAILLGAVRSRDVLKEDALVMSDIAIWAPLITAGVFAATLSSALGSMMGSPRILQAFSRDGVLPVLRPFSMGSGPSGEPRRATILTFIIAQACILPGDLNAIAPVITMAFMITYGTLNLATFYEAFTRNPSYRPRFRWCHWASSLVGAAACLGVMLLISWYWAAISIAAMVAIYWLISQREIEANWGDIRSGLAFERARRNLRILEDELYHPKNWRPILLTMSGAGSSRRHLAIYGHWLTAGHGIQTLGQVIQGDVRELLDRRVAQREVLRTFIHDENLTAFPVVVVAPSVNAGIVSLVQCHGLGGLEPNTVLLGWPGARDRWPAFLDTIRLVAGLRRSIILVRSREQDEVIWTPPRGSIDVWWRGRDNGPLLLLLAHLLTQNPGWRNRRIRLMRVIQSEAAEQEVLGHLRGLARESRIPATASVHQGDDPLETIQRVSSDAAVVLIGFKPPQGNDDGAFFERLAHMTEKMPRVITAYHAGGVELES